VVSCEGARKVLLSLGGGAPDARGAIVKKDVVATAEQLPGKEGPQRAEAAAYVVQGDRLEIPNCAVDEKGADCLGVVLLGELLSPGRKVSKLIWFARLSCLTLAHFAWRFGRRTLAFDCHWSSEGKERIPRWNCRRCLYSFSTSSANPPLSL